MLIEKFDNSFQRQSPYGEDDWINTIAIKYDIISTINPRGKLTKVIVNE